ncbi:tetratricopeptide repeat protein [bacterium]|nr:tetratricopeptide repeat protein [bacterium]
MRIRISVKDALLITISLILILGSYFRLKDYEIRIERVGWRPFIIVNNTAAKKYEDIAVEALYAKDYTKALEYFNKQLKANPKNPEDVYHNIGMTYYYMRDYNKAIENFNKSVELDDKLISTYFYLGLSYYDSGKSISRARENFEKVITMEGRNKVPEMVRISYDKLGWIEELYGQHQKAQELWEKSNHYADRN